MLKCRLRNVNHFAQPQYVKGVLSSSATSLEKPIVYNSAISPQNEECFQVHHYLSTQQFHGLFKYTRTGRLLSLNGLPSKTNL